MPAKPSVSNPSRSKAVRTKSSPRTSAPGKAAPAKPSSVAEYLAALPPDRREAISAVRRVILKNLDKDYEEGLSYNMIGYFVPHRVYPPGYHCNPQQGVPFAGLGSQKNHMSLYVMCSYGSPEEERWIREQFAKAGKKLDMGKACIRFRKLDDLPLEVIGEMVRRVPAKAYIERYTALLAGRGRPAAARGAKGAPATSASARASGSRTGNTPKATSLSRVKAASAAKTKHRTRRTPEAP